jgi:hypothetical protein
MKKVALFVFNGEPVCFVHVLLNALDMNEKGYDVKVIIEGAATKLINDLSEGRMSYAPLYEKVKAAGLIDCVCQACSKMMGSTDAVKAENLPMCGEMMGHPGMARYIDAGFTLLIF